MMIELTLRPTVINGARYHNDFVVWWRSRQFGRRPVGRIMKAHGRPFGSPEWSFHIIAGLPVLSGNGMAENLDQAKVGFRKAFERFEAETPDRVWARYYECVASMRDRQQKATWTAKFDDPIPLPDGGSIKNLSQARAYLLSLSEREQLQPKWQQVASHLIKATTVEQGWTFFARVALYKAIHGKGPDGPPAPDVKRPDTWRERRRARNALRPPSPRSG